MKVFKFKFILCLIVIFILGASNSILYASIRCGILSAGVGDDKELHYSLLKAGSYAKKLLSLQKKYTSLIVDAINKNGNFSAEFFAQNANKEYKPIVSNTMLNETASDQYLKALASYARSIKCRYLISPNIVITNNPNAITVDIYAGFFDAKNENFKSFTSNATASLSKENKSQNLKDKLISEATEKLAEYISEEFTGNKTKIASVQNNLITINKGANAKISAGDVYIVQSEITDGNNIFDSASDSNKKIDLAIIKIKNVEENSSIAEIFENAGNIKAISAGDILKHISQIEINAYLAGLSSGQMKFPDKHPEIKKPEIKEIKEIKKAEAKNTTAKTNNKKSPAPSSALSAGVMRIGIIKFDSKTDWISENEAASITDMLSRILSKSDKIAILERDRLNLVLNEQKLNLLGLIDTSTAIKIGKLTGCKYILLGSVTDFDEINFTSGKYINPLEKYMNQKYDPNAQIVKAGVNILSAVIEKIENPKTKNAQKNNDNVITETHEIITTVDARLINVETGQIILTLSEKGSNAQSNVITQDENGNLKNVEVNYGSLENKAITSTVANLGYKIREAIANERVQISSINDDELIINRGNSSGVQADDLFCVYSEGQSYGDTEAIIKIKDVQENFSTAEVVAKINNYSPIVGSRLEPVLNTDFQKGIWHIKNLRRSEAENLQDKNNQNKKALENSSTDPKKVIKTYGLNPNEEKKLIDAHLKALKPAKAEPKYKLFKEISDENNNDYLAAFKTGENALKLSMYVEAREWAMKALFINPNYKPAQDLINKIDGGK